MFWCLKWYHWFPWIDNKRPTNKKQHFLNILKNNGFNIEEHGQNKKLDKTKNNEMKEKIEEDKEIKGHVNLIK